MRTSLNAKVELMRCCCEKLKMMVETNGKRGEKGNLGGGWLFIFKTANAPSLQEIIKNRTPAVLYEGRQGGGRKSFRTSASLINANDWKGTIG